MIAKTMLFLGLLIVGIPLAQASAVQVNGACEVGSCSDPDVLAFGFTSLTPFNFSYQFANTDTYQLQGFVVAANLSSKLRIGVANFVVTYLGNSSNTASSNDVLTADFLQPIAHSSSTNENVFESIGGFFEDGLGIGTSAEAQLLIAGQGLPILGPYTAPPSAFSHSASGVLNIPAGAPLLDYRYTLTFGEGSSIGASLSDNNGTSPVPEPGTLGLIASGMLGLLSVGRRQLLTV